MERALARASCLGAFLGVGDDRGQREDRVRLRLVIRGLEVLAVRRDHAGRIQGPEVAGVREAGPEGGRRLAAVRAGAEDPDRRQRYVVRLRGDRGERVAGREALGVRAEFGVLLGEVVGAERLPAAAQGERGALVGAGRAADAEVDAVGIAGRPARGTSRRPSAVSGSAA